MSFEWDLENERAAWNLRPHQVSLAEAADVSGDPLSSAVADPDHSEGEHRDLLFGQPPARRHLVVALAERGGRVRIVSAREMTRSERKAYEQ